MNEEILAWRTCYLSNLDGNWEGNDDDDLGLRARRLHGHMAPITTTMSFQVKRDQCEVNGHKQLHFHPLGYARDKKKTSL